MSCQHDFGSTCVLCTIGINSCCGEDVQCIKCHSEFCYKCSNFHCIGYKYGNFCPVCEKIKDETFCCEVITDEQIQKYIYDKYKINNEDIKRQIRKLSIKNMLKNKMD